MRYSQLVEYTLPVMVQLGTDISRQQWYTSSDHSIEWSLNALVRSFSPHDISFREVRLELCLARYLWRRRNKKKQTWSEEKSTSQMSPVFPVPKRRCLKSGRSGFNNRTARASQTSWVASWATSNDLWKAKCVDVTLRSSGVHKSELGQSCSGVVAVLETYDGATQRQQVSSYRFHYYPLFVTVQYQIL